MKCHRITSVLGALLVLLNAMRPALAARDCTVLNVTDGDSLTVRCDSAVLPVRLAQIDAPELEQAHGRRSREALRKLLKGREIQAELVGEDDYGRQLALVSVDGKVVNRLLVRDGHAWVYRRYLQDPSWLGDEQFARVHRVGLWRQDKPIAPWRFRAIQSRRENSLPAAPVAKHSQVFGERQ